VISSGNETSDLVYSKKYARNLTATNYYVNSNYDLAKAAFGNSACGGFRTVNMDNYQYIKVSCFQREGKPPRPIFFRLISRK
jgi:hypothetical protein